MRVEALLTTLTRDYDRISMHGVRRILLENGRPRAWTSASSDSHFEGRDQREYESKMGEASPPIADAELILSAFGDLFLQDIQSLSPAAFSPSRYGRPVSDMGKRNTSHLIRSSST